MNLINKTGSTIFWSSSQPGAGDCGTIDPGKSYYYPVSGTWQITFSPKDPQYFQVNADGNQNVTLSMTVTNPTAADERNS